MRHPPSAEVASVGVAAVRLAVERDLAWVFREQPTDEYGIDAQVEIVEGGIVSGKLLGFQIKSGVSWFNEPGPGGWWYRPDADHVQYWASHSLPVLVILYHPGTGRCHWQLVSQDALARTLAGRPKIFVPETQILDERARKPLTEAASRPGNAAVSSAPGLAGGLGQPGKVRKDAEQGTGFSDHATAFPSGHDLSIAGPGRRIPRDHDAGRALERLPPGAAFSVAVAHEVRAGRAGAVADFEQMIGLLVRATSGQEANLIYPDPGDWGIDVLTGDLRMKISAWQVKYFTGRLTHDRQNYFHSSFSSAVKAASTHGYALERWTLCLPDSLDGVALRRWHGWKARNEQATAIAIELWDETRLRELLLRPEATDVYRHYYAPYVAGDAATEQPVINFAVHQAQAGLVGAQEDFKQMTARLVRTTLGQDASLLPAPGEWGGTGALIGDSNGRTIIWQPKYFAHGVGRRQRDQVESSFTSAIRAARDHGYAPERWVLCIPSSMAAPTLQWWHAWRAGQDDSGVAVDLWDETRLRELLLRPEAAHVYRRYYSPYPRTGEDPGGGTAPSDVASNLIAANGGTPVTSRSKTASPHSQGHAFISYVREDSGGADELQQVLEDAGISVWRDTADLWPGEDWRARIREAITRDALVFIACFSSQSISRRESYQNEELLLAIEQLRCRQPGDLWLIPVRFDDCDLPGYDLGAGRTLASIQRADFFGPERHRAAERLAAAVRRIL